jgi:hypothetical protein
MVTFSKLFSNYLFIYFFLGIDTAKNASDLLDKYLIDALNKMIENSNDEIIHSSQLDFNQLNHITKNAFLQLDKHLAGLINDQSGSVSVRIILIKLFIYFKSLDCFFN